MSSFTSDSRSTTASSIVGPSTATLIVFDWDDTLCPSSWLSQNKLTLDDPPTIPAHYQVLLDKMAEVAIETLRIASSLGSVVIVTNAEEGWVEMSCKRFLPQLLGELINVKHISARTRYHTQTDFPHCPFAWKRKAFNDELHSFFSTLDTPKLIDNKSIISLGDSPHERIAAMSINR